MKKIFYAFCLMLMFVTGYLFGFKKSDDTYVLRAVANAPQTVQAVAVAPVKIVGRIGWEIVKGTTDLVTFPFRLVQKQFDKKGEEQ